jgi:hypothetical protein
VSADVLPLDAATLDRLLTETEVAEACDWFAEVLPNRWVIRAGLLSEGRLAADTLLKGWEGSLGCHWECANPQLRCWRSITYTRCYVSAQPPAVLVRALLAANGGLS